MNFTPLNLILLRITVISATKVSGQHRECWENSYGVWGGTLTKQTSLNPGTFTSEVACAGAVEQKVCLFNRLRAVVYIVRERQRSVLDVGVTDASGILGLLRPYLRHRHSLVLLMMPERNKGREEDE